MRMTVAVYRSYFNKYQVVLTFIMGLLDNRSLTKSKRMNIKNRITTELEEEIQNKSRNKMK